MESTPVCGVAIRKLVQAPWEAPSLRRPPARAERQGNAQSRRLDHAFHIARGEMFVVDGLGDKCPEQSGKEEPQKQVGSHFSHHNDQSVPVVFNILPHIINILLFPKFSCLLLTRQKYPEILAIWLQRCAIYDLRFTGTLPHGTTLRDFVACVGLSTKLLPLTGLLKEKCQVINNIPLLK